MKTSPNAKGIFALFVILFFCSGCAGLIYQVLWMRQFGLIMGNTTISLSAVLTAFMGGLAIGSYWGGRVADRRYDHLRLYGVLEVLIGLYAACIPFLIHSIQPVLASLYRENPNGWALQYTRFGLALAIMIVPTIFMGATLPLLIKHFTIRGGEIGRRTGIIYGVNTVGAMFGAFLAGFFLIPMAGMAETNWTAVAINLAVGLVAFIIGGPNRSPQSAADAPADLSAPSDFTPLPAMSRRLALAGIAISGVAAMIYQVCWTRMFALLIGSSTYSFSLVVMANIGGLALGGMMFGRWIDRSNRPMLFFAVLQALTALAAFCIAWFSYLFPLFVLRLLERHQGNYLAVLINEFAMVALIILIPTFLMGGMFPVVARICARNVSELGRTIGTVYAWNTLGAVIGSFSAGLILMNYLGIGWTLTFAVGMNLLVAALAAIGSPGRPAILRWAIVCCAAAAGIFAFLNKPQWQPAIMTSAPFMASRHSPESLHGTQFFDEMLQRNIVYYRDGVGSTVSVMKGDAPFPTVSLSVNGKPEASNWPTDMPTQLLCGHLGMLLHPDARQVLLIGLGGGVTLSSVLKHEAVRRVDLVEISKSVVEAVRLHFAEVNHHALDDERVNLTVADGRNHVTLTDQTYDLIINVPSNPWMAGISNLFTREFFEMCRDRLNPDGVMCQWIHTYNLSYDDFMMVVRTYMETMPHAIIWQVTRGDCLMIGSKQPIQLDWEQLGGVMALPVVKEHLDWAGLGDPKVLLSDFLATKEHVATLADYQKAGVNVDNTCRLEWQAPKSFYESDMARDYSLLDRLRQSPAAAFRPESIAAMDDETREWLERIVPARLKGNAGFAKFGSMETALMGFAEMEEALKINPYDHLLRAETVDVLASIGGMALASGDRVGFTMLKRALHWRRLSGFSMDPFTLAQSMRIGERVAEWTGQEEFAAECRELFFQIGGQELMDIIDNGQAFQGFVDRKADIVRALGEQSPADSSGAP